MACFRLLHDDDDDDETISHPVRYTAASGRLLYIGHNRLLVVAKVSFPVCGMFLFTFILFHFFETLCVSLSFCDAIESDFSIKLRCITDAVLDCFGTVVLKVNNSCILQGLH